MFTFFCPTKDQALLPVTQIASDDVTISVPTIDIPQEEDKTLLGNYWFNASMTFLQDIPQTIATIVVMATTGLQNDPNNPTGVSLPGYLDLIPQIGNTMAGTAATYAASEMFSTYRTTPSKQLLLKACLYAVFGISTMLNGTGNIAAMFLDPSNNKIEQFAMITTFMALSSNFSILLEEEARMLQKEDKSLKDNISLLCSINLNISIITAFLATTKLANRNVGAYGYLWGTWAGQVPELIEPTKQRIKKQVSEISDYVRNTFSLT